MGSSVAGRQVVDQGGRVAVVTGAARGVGAAVVYRLASEGWRVVAVDCCADMPSVEYALGTEAQLKEVADPFPGTVLPVVADVRDEAALAA
ncbi:MAG TPA: SDR family NAD(P)-dependent oxidoreductase, partial [Pseudonocardia sp.]